MLRRRPLQCPFCGADVRERVECTACGEPLPGVPVHHPPRLRGTLARLAGALACLAYLVAHGSPRWGWHLAVVAGVAFLSVVIGLRRPLLRLEQRLAARLGWTRPQELASDGDSAVVTTRGRVRVLTPCEAGGEAAAVLDGRHARTGRFVVEGPGGEALIDDDDVVLGPHTFVVLEGDLVEVRGLARREPGPAVGEYRHGQGALVYEGSASAPILVCAIGRAGGPA